MAKMGKAIAIVMKIKRIIVTMLVRKKSMMRKTVKMMMMKRSMIKITVRRSFMKAMIVILMIIT